MLPFKFKDDFWLLEQFETIYMVFRSLNYTNVGKKMLEATQCGSGSETLFSRLQICGLSCPLPFSAFSIVKNITLGALPVSCNKHQYPLTNSSFRLFQKEFTIHGIINYKDTKSKFRHLKIDL
jgi:hypothetical protein